MWWFIWGGLGLRELFLKMLLEKAPGSWAVRLCKGMKTVKTVSLQNTLPSFNACEHWTPEHSTDTVLVPKPSSAAWSKEIIPQAFYEDSVSATWKTQQLAGTSCILLGLVYFSLSSPLRPPFPCSIAVDSVILSWYHWFPASALRGFISTHHLCPMPPRYWYNGSVITSQLQSNCQVKARVILR